MQMIQFIFADSPEKLEHSLNGFVTYWKSWKLNINYDKTKIVIFGARIIDKLVFEMEGVNIEIVKNYKYLGVFFLDNGSLLSARKCIYEKSQQSNAFII